MDRDRHGPVTKPVNGIADILDDRIIHDIFIADRCRHGIPQEMRATVKDSGGLFLTFVCEHSHIHPPSVMVRGHSGKTNQPVVLELSEHNFLLNNVTVGLQDRFLLLRDLLQGEGFQGRQDRIRGLIPKLS